jgi:hypothetical protein
MAAATRDRWRDLLVENVDRALERVYLSDPVLYAELVRLRQRLQPKAETEQQGENTGWRTATTGDAR